MSYKYALNENVQSGRIIGVLHPQYIVNCAALSGKFTNQDECMAEYDRAWGVQWRTAPIYAVHLAELTRPMSYEDFMFHEKTAPYLEGLLPEEYREVYERMCPLQYSLTIPEHLIEAQVLGEGGFDRTVIKEKSNGES
jgi:hypothetical protein